MSFVSKILNSFILRTAILTAALFAALVALMLGLAYWLMIKHPLENVRDHVQNDMVALIAEYRDAKDEASLIEMLEQYGDENAARPFFYLLLNQDNKILAGNLPLDPSVFQGEGWTRVEFETGYSENSALVRKVILPGKATLIVGRDIEDLDEREELITETLGWSASLALFLGLFGGLVISLAVSRRIEAINKTALTVMNGKLGSRIPVRGSDDDFDNLSTTLNTMLDRIEELLGIVSSASNNIAHELRTPLARLTADLDDIEDYLNKTRTEPELTLMIDKARAQADRMRQIFDALLRISRIQSRRDKGEFQSVNLKTVMDEAVGLYAPIAKQKDIMLVLESEAAVPPIKGDANLLFQAITNIIDNALKFTPHGGEAHIDLKADQNCLLFKMTDTGPGVPEEEKERLGERFFQSESSKESEKEGQILSGNGLGLALVQAIVEIHDGRLRFPKTTTGLAVVLEFPLRPVSYISQERVRAKRQPKA